MDEPLIPQRDSARQRALRIPLAYHRTRGPLWAWRLVFTLACFLARFDNHMFLFVDNRSRFLWVRSNVFRYRLLRIRMASFAYGFYDAFWHPLGYPIW